MDRGLSYLLSSKIFLVPRNSTSTKSFKTKTFTRNIELDSVFWISKNVFKWQNDNKTKNNDIIRLNNQKEKELL